MKYAFLGVILATTGCSEHLYSTGLGDQGLGGDPITDTDTVDELPLAICGAISETTSLGEAVILAGSDSYDPAGVGIAEYEWRFVDVPDGSGISMPAGNDANREVVPDVSGDYAAELVVRTEDGRESAPCLASFVANDLPVAVCDITPDDISVSETATLVGSGSHDPAGMEITEYQWRFVELPEASVVTMPGGNASNREFSPDVTGEYVAELVVRTEDGRESEPCITSADIAISVLPVAVCSADPEEVAPPFESTTFIGENSYDPAGLEITEYEWQLIELPEGSAVVMPGGNAANRQLTPDVAGDYVAELVVRTEDGRESAPCVTAVSAIPQHHLWIEMYWVNGGDDMDLHLLAPGGSPRTGTDCYYGNCRGGLPWGAAGTADDPYLDIDDIPGTGPENINILDPQDGIFTVFVHDYPGSVFEGGNDVTVNVYIDGNLEWSDTRTISGENSDEYYCTISWPDAEIFSL